VRRKVRTEYLSDEIVGRAVEVRKTSDEQFRLQLTSKRRQLMIQKNFTRYDNRGCTTQLQWYHVKQAFFCIIIIATSMQSVGTYLATAGLSCVYVFFSFSYFLYLVYISVRCVSSTVWSVNKDYESYAIHIQLFSQQFERKSGYKSKEKLSLMRCHEQKI